MPIDDDDYHQSTGLRRPFIWTLPLSKRTLLFADLTSKSDAYHSMTDDAFRLILDAARRADNVGIDEIPSIDYFRRVLSFYDDVIALYDDVTTTTGNDVTRTMVGLVLVSPCRYVRSCHPSNCAVMIVTDESLSSRLVWRDLVRFGFDVGVRGPLHYTGCTVDVFVTCCDLAAALRDEGFVIVACVPDAGLVTGFPGRHIDSYVMYKELDIPPKPMSLDPRYSTDAIQRSIGFRTDEISDDDVNLLAIPFLPLSHVLADGTPIVIRAMRRDEIVPFYAAIKEAAASGLGYGLDELPNIEYFIRWYVSDFCNIVFELTSAVSTVTTSTETSDSAVDSVPDRSIAGIRGTSGRVFAYANFGPSLFSRSVDHPVLADGNIVLLPEFRGRHWSTEMNRIQMAVSHDVGYRIVLAETAISSMQSIASLRHSGGVTMIGSIPRGIYFRDVGWTDLVMLHKTLTESCAEMTTKKTDRQWLPTSKI